MVKHILSKGKGLTGGYLQGYGYLEFSYSMVGLGFPSNTIGGAITGNYIGAPSSEGFPSGANPFNFAGQGSSTTNFGITTWKGFSANSINWIGEANGVGLSIPGIDELFSHSKFRTYTDLLTGLGERQGYIWNKFYQKEE